MKRLAKKYPSLKNEYVEVVKLLKQYPKQGTPIGQDCYKIRISIASKGKGKSGGARIITHLQITQTTIYLFSIYDKSEQSDVDDKDLRMWVKMIDNS